MPVQIKMKQRNFCRIKEIILDHFVPGVQLLSLTTGASSSEFTSYLVLFMWVVQLHHAGLATYTLPAHSNAAFWFPCEVSLKTFWAARFPPRSGPTAGTQPLAGSKGWPPHLLEILREGLSSHRDQGSANN